jgi:hypothetical protein
VLEVEIDDDEMDSGRRADQRIRVPDPPLPDPGLVVGGVLEAAGGAWRLGLE